MKQFNLEEFLKDKSRKVVSRDGRPVRIVCWDRKYNHNDFPIIALEEWDNGEYVSFVSSNGRVDLSGSENTHDLFFADEEDELTEFEKDLQTIISDASHWTSNDGSISTYCQFGDKEIKKISTQILDLARKEVMSEISDFEIYDKGFKEGKKYALKSLPKLEKAKDVIDPTIPVMYTCAASMKSYVEYNGYKVCINELFESLQRENKL